MRARNLIDFFAPIGFFLQKNSVLLMIEAEVFRQDIGNDLIHVNGDPSHGFYQIVALKEAESEKFPEKPARLPNFLQRLLLATCVNSMKTDDIPPLNCGT